MELIRCENCTADVWERDCRSLHGRYAFLEMQTLDDFTGRLDSETITPDDALELNKTMVQHGWERAEEQLEAIGCQLTREQIANNLLAIREKFKEMQSGR